LIFGLLAVSVTFSLIGTGCILIALRRPFGKTINNVKWYNKEFVKLIPVLRGETPLIINKLEIIRMGLSEGNKNIYSIYVNEFGDDNQIKIAYNHDYYHSSNFSEKLEEFSAEQIKTINYLFLSDELQLNALNITFSNDPLRIESVFAKSDDGWYALGIFYFSPDNDELNQFRHDGDYLEELGNNYWLVMWFVERY